MSDVITDLVILNFSPQGNSNITESQKKKILLEVRIVQKGVNKLGLSPFRSVLGKK